MIGEDGITRREIGLFGLMAVASTLLPRGSGGRAGAALSGSAIAPPLTPAEALARLEAGHARFLAGEVMAPHQERALMQLAGGQHPFAAIVACADSRVAPELLFDCGVGELFVVRNAGNSVSPVAMGSLEYAVEHLHVPLIVVMGHQRCGAVTAAVEVDRKGVTLPGSLGPMVAPLLAAAHDAHDAADPVPMAIDANVTRTVAQLKKPGSLLSGPLAAGRLAVVGARLDFDSAKVRFFS